LSQRRMPSQRRSSWGLLRCQKNLPFLTHCSKR
jgi:hypothetical protein